MELPRLQLFELNDSTWAPAPLRDTIIEALSRSLRWGRMMGGLVEPFEAFLAAAGTREVLDIASGAGGPARILAGEIQRAGRSAPRFVLTDLRPQLAAWEEARAEFPGVIAFEPAPVDATQIPAAIAAGRARLIINAFHHLPPGLAASILEDAARSRSPIFVSEAFERGPLGFAPMIPMGVLALALNPLLSPRDRLSKAWLTWATPIALLGSAWDGVVSTMRVYDRSDLQAMVAPFGEDFTWTYGNYDYPLGGRGYYFHGVPRR
jgi:hypothetical protein